MLTRQWADQLRAARKALDLTQKELARRVGVSQRLVAEVERGERPNVSLETALRMLREVGVTVHLTDSSGATHELRDAATRANARAARAALRRATWQGRQIRLRDEGADPPTSPSPDTRLADVRRVSQHAFAVAAAAPTRAKARR